MNSSLEIEIIFLNPKDNLDENKLLVLSKEIPLSRVLINAKTESQMNNAFNLSMIYWDNYGKNIAIRYSFFEEFKWKLLIPLETSEHNEFLCKKITFEYQESDIQTHSKNREIVFNFSATEINDIDRKRYTDDFTVSIEEYNKVFND